MSLDTDVEVLRRIPFFQAFSAEQLKLVAFSAESRSLPDRLLLYDEGQLLHSAYVIVSGKLRAQRKSRDGEAVESWDIEPGVILSDKALILDVRATESMRVASRTQVLQIRKVMFRRLMQEHPEIAITLRARLSQDLMQTVSRLNAVAGRLKAIAS